MFQLAEGNSIYIVKYYMGPLLPPAQMHRFILLVEVPVPVGSVSNIAVMLSRNNNEGGRKCKGHNKEVTVRVG